MSTEIRDIIAVDPGLVTGCAHVRVSGPGDFEVVSTAELSPYDTGVWFTTALTQVDRLATTLVVIERFTITPKTAANSQAPWSLEVIGQTKWIMKRHDPEWEPQLQTPSDAKTVMPNPRLKALGLWHVGGKGHALDALRHAGLALHRRRMISS